MSDMPERILAWCEEDEYIDHVLINKCWGGTSEVPSWDATEYVRADLMKNRVGKDAKAHEKELAVWAENYAALEQKVARLEVALVEHNDLLRSALAIAKREGVDGEIASTNWDAYYNSVAVVLKRHHQTANEARAARTDGGKDG